MWEHCLSAGWLGWSLLLHQDQRLGLLAKTLMLETFSEMKKQLTEISLPVPPILLLLLPPILSVKRGEVRHRPPLNPLLPLDRVKKKVQQALLHDLSVAVQTSEQTPQSKTPQVINHFGFYLSVRFSSLAPVTFSTSSLTASLGANVRGNNCFTWTAST